MFGVERCSTEDWSSLAVYVFVCASICCLAVRNTQYEQKMKTRYGPGLTNGDIKLDRKAMGKLVIFSFFGGWVSGALGCGGGSIFNPVLLSFGVPPKVASASSMYMIMFSTGASTMTYIINGMLDFTYGPWVGAFCLVGTFLGMQALQLFMKKMNR